MNNLILRKSQLDIIVLDGSGSMADKWQDTIAALDIYVQELGKEGINSNVLLYVFTTKGGGFYFYKERDCPADEWIHLRQQGITSHWGATPLYDAINQMGLQVRDIDPKKCAITIATDGEENHSQTNLTQAKAILDWCRAKTWQVTFLGCDFNNQRMASLLGGSPSSAVGVQQALLSDAAKSLAKKRAKYGLYGAPMHWSEEEQQQFGGYLAPPREDR